MSLAAPFPNPDARQITGGGDVAARVAQGSVKFDF
jgi:hypothetical protein